MDVKERQLASVEQETVLRGLAEAAARPHCRFLEVGSWCGDSTVILARVAQAHGGLLFCVDWWKGNDATELAEIAAQEDIFAHFWQRICREGLADVVIPIRGRSDLVAEVLRDNSFDLVFLDAEHGYDGVRRDIRSYAPLVKGDGGIFCGHDCDGRVTDYDADFLEAGKDVDFYQSVHCGVVCAVGAAFPNCSLNHSIWSVRAGGSENAWKPTQGRSIVQRSCSLPPCGGGWGWGDNPPEPFPRKGGGRNTERPWEPTNLTFPGIADRPLSPPVEFARLKSHCLLRYGRRLYAVPYTFGSFDVTDEQQRNHPHVLSAETREELQEAIERLALPQVAILREEGYLGFNLIEYDDRLYAISQDSGLLDVAALTAERIEELERVSKLFVTDSVKTAKARIDAIPLAPPPPPVAVLLEEAHLDFNLIDYDGRTYAVAQDAGLVDVTTLTAATMAKMVQARKLFVTQSLEVAKQWIETLPRPQPPSVFKEVYLGFNLLEFEGQVHAIAQEAGQIDLPGLPREVIAKLASASRLFVTDSVEAARARIDAIPRKPPPLPVATLVQQGYLGFNLVDYGGRVFALAQELGPIDVTRLTAATVGDLEGKRKLYVTGSSETAKARVAEDGQLAPATNAFVETSLNGCAKSG
jgi:hypothetical protein